jgi:hypothetical protein
VTGERGKSGPQNPKFVKSKPKTHVLKNLGYPEKNRVGLCVEILCTQNMRAQDDNLQPFSFAVDLVAGVLS